MTNRQDGSPDVRVSGVILAGGRSSRMGEDKAGIVLDGRTLLQHVADALAEVVDELVVVGAPGRPIPGVASPLPCRLVEDPIEGEGPLLGIATGLRAAHGAVALVVACDMPYLRPALLQLLATRALEGPRLVVPLHGGRPEGLCSAWRRDALEVVQRHIEAGDRAVMSVAADLEVLRLRPEDYAGADPTGDSFVNLNTTPELEAARRELGRRG